MSSLTCRGGIQHSFVMLAIYLAVAALNRNFLQIFVFFLPYALSLPTMVHGANLCSHPSQSLIFGFTSLIYIHAVLTAGHCLRSVLVLQHA